jgi:hypothetical protein
LDFGEGVGDVILVIHVLGTDFKSTSTALSSDGKFRERGGYLKNKVDHFCHCGSFVIFIAFNPF